MKIVLDVSAALPVLFEEDQALETAKIISSADSVIAPEIFIPELGNALWKYVKFAKMETSRAEKLLAMGLGSIDVFYGQKVLIQRAFGLALDNGLSVYDSMYLSLCSTSGHKLLSRDNRLNKVAKHLQFILE